MHATPYEQARGARGARGVHVSKRHRKCVESSSSCSSDDDFVAPD
jgi:hypothetical protein